MTTLSRLLYFLGIINIYQLICKTNKYSLLQSEVVNFAPKRARKTCQQICDNILSEKSYMEMFGFKKTVRKVKKKTKVKWTAKFGGNLNIDGMTVDSKGIIYGAGLSAGIVYGWDPKTGKLIRVIHTPGSAVNCVIGKGKPESMIIVGSHGIAVAELP